MTGSGEAKAGARSRITATRTELVIMERFWTLTDAEVSVWLSFVEGERGYNDTGHICQIIEHRDHQRQGHLRDDRIVTS